MIKGTITKEELHRRVANAVGVVKLVCGVGNNAAWMVCLEAHDYIKNHERYRQTVKGGHPVSWYYCKVFKMYREYERQLIYARNNRMFCVDDLTEKARKSFGKISNREYYEFWAGSGNAAYSRKHSMVTSLWNKYRLSLLNHGVSQPDLLAWSMTAQACLELAVQMYEQAIDSEAKLRNLPIGLLREVLEQFSMKDIAKVWRMALDATDPTVEYELDEIEERNISMGLVQLQEAWSSTSTLYGSLSESIESYEEVFRTKGEKKKALRLVAEAKAEVDSILEE